VQELHQMLHDAMHLADAGPVAIRYPRGQARQVGEHEVGSGLHARLVRRAAGPADRAVCVLAIGKLVAGAVKAAETLAGEGVEVTVWDVRSCAPLDDEMLGDAATHRAVVTVEDGVRDGGVGMAIADRVGAIAPAVPIHVLGIPSRFLAHSSSPDHILSQLGLDGDGIAATIRERC
jgi:1-deoxy-D-xylulose-5-phosphate synthase